MANGPNNSYLDPINDPKSHEYDPNADLNDPINDTKTIILTLMTQNSTITYKELADSIDISPSTVKRHIQELKTSGAISRIGGAKGGRWEVRWR